MSSSTQTYEPKELTLSQEERLDLLAGLLIEIICEELCAD